ncbi:winged-helix domain-containing protein [Crateriforma conspicua]|uniref:winged-helix domain-containing protein n=1 Tax=Crateriforma conspicua TaxID=2527996 RepID=UPI00118D25F0|nr:winged-helix domain-containing protein [Crateriforma conspicua]QDV63058.1 hypothetical protein Mal65_21970 [Crateriforma conspicua]
MKLIESPNSRRYRQFERLLLVIELLAPLRLGAMGQEIADDVRDILGERISDRTIRRDCEALVELGLVDRTSPAPARYRWRGRTMRSESILRSAELHAELTS